MSEALALRGVQKRFGGVLALDGVDLSLREGELHALIGPNGAGKSTLFGVLSGEHRPDRGQVVLGGRDVTRLDAAKRVRLGVARAFQVARVFAEASVAENVRVALLAAEHRTSGWWRPAPGQRVAEGVRAALERMGLEGLAERPARELSQGDRKRLELAMALVLRPKVLLLDEPTAGMSPAETAQTVALVRELWEAERLTVLLTEHDMGVVFDLAERLTVLHQGAVLCSGDPSEVRARDDVAQVYLGGGARR